MRPAPPDLPASLFALALLAAIVVFGLLFDHMAF